MATFEVKVLPIRLVEDHPNADRLSIVWVNDFCCISAKVDGQHRYQAGDHVCYIPEGAILPEWLLKEMDFWNHEENKGTLNGPEGNRVKTAKLRGIVSIGVIYPASNLKFMATVGDDVAEQLGITKYEPTIPSSMSGDVVYVHECVTKFDVENLKKYPDILIEGEDVIFTEKLHGSATIFGFIKGLKHPDLTYSEILGGSFFVASKGLGSQGLVFKHSEENYARNIYLQMEREHKVFEKMESIILDYGPVSNAIERFIMFGETFGQGVQDLGYGTKKTFRYFLVRVNDQVMNVDGATNVVNGRFDSVPIIYRGAYSRELADAYRSGNTTFSNVKQIREGIVIYPVTPRRDDLIGQVYLKHVSDDYLLRKKGTEYS